jgi:autotransporter-associated beta strand protein
VNSTGSSAEFLAGSSYEFRSGTVSARLGGPGTLTKTTSGTVTLSGANTFTGGSTVQAGTLDLAGSLNSSVSVDGGVLALGAATGIRTVNGSLTVNSGGALRIRINGTTAGSQYDQLRLTNAASTATLNGTLDLVAAPGLAAGGTFRIVDNSGSSTAITGTFTGLPQNAEFYEDGQWWRISYTGGTGNDVVLTRIAPTAWQSWQATHFGTAANDPAIAGPAADLERDAIVNFLEFALGLDPNAASVLPISLVKNGATLEFTYSRSKAAVLDGVAFQVEWSDAMLAGSWSGVGVSESILSDDGVRQTVRATTAAGTAGERFLRLRATR